MRETAGHIGLTLLAVAWCAAAYELLSLWLGWSSEAPIRDCLPQFFAGQFGPDTTRRVALYSAAVFIPLFVGALLLVRRHFRGDS